jgi:hypothetical protein
MLDPRAKMEMQAGADSPEFREFDKPETRTAEGQSVDVGGTASSFSTGNVSLNFKSLRRSTGGGDEMIR